MSLAKSAADASGRVEAGRRKRSGKSVREIDDVSPALAAQVIEIERRLAKSPLPPAANDDIAGVQNPYADILAAGGWVDVTTELRRISNCSARLAALNGEKAMALDDKRRDVVENRVQLISGLMREILEIAELDGSQMGYAPFAIGGVIPIWTKQLRHMDGSRVTPIEHFERHWKTGVEEGHFTSGDLRKKNPALYNALAVALHRNGQKIGDLFVSPHKPHTRTAARAAGKGRHRLTKMTR